MSSLGNTIFLKMLEARELQRQRDIEAEQRQYERTQDAYKNIDRIRAQVQAEKDADWQRGQQIAATQGQQQAELGQAFDNSGYANDAQKEQALMGYNAGKLKEGADARALQIAYMKANPQWHYIAEAGKNNRAAASNELKAQNYASQDEARKAAAELGRSKLAETQDWHGTQDQNADLDRALKERLGWGNIGARQAAAAAAATRGEGLKPAEIEKIRKLDVYTSKINRIRQVMNETGVSTGKIADWEAKLKAGTAAQDPEYSRFTNSIGNLVNVMVHDYYGSAQTPQELAKAARWLPMAESNSPAAITQILNEMEADFGNERKVSLGTYQRAGRNVDALMGGPTTPQNYNQQPSDGGEQIREVGGVKYRKVPGGWEAVE